jgi:adenylate cyclase
MSVPAAQRRLSAILAADVVGYSTLMAEDETGTLAALKLHRRTLFDPETAKRGGRIVKLMGDGALVEFPSVVDAVDCALAIQRALAAEGGKIRLRIGINLGDVIVDGDDIYGDGVNVAARLEALAAPGGVSVSGVVHESLGNRVDARFVDAGEVPVKNMTRPIRVWRWQPGDNPAPARHGEARPPLPDKPSIAVLPFANMSPDGDQEFFADGISEDLITEISRFHSLFVTSRNSAFSFKGQATNLKEISARLGVRYIVEGSVRRAGSRVRITAQLIDAVEDSHLWAERYDRQIEDIFEVQDEVVRAIVSAIEPQLLSSERNRALRKPPESLDAWESYQRGLWHSYRFRPEERETALAFFEQAIALDARFAPAHAGLGMALYVYSLLGGAPDHAADIDRAVASCMTAIGLDENDPLTYLSLCRCLVLKGQPEAAILAAEKALRLNPGFGAAHFGRAHALWHGGRAGEALASHDAAIRLSPRDPSLWAFQASKAIALALSGALEQAIDVSRSAQQQANAAIFAHVGELLALGLLERGEAAADAIQRARKVMPAVTVGYLDAVLPITDPPSRALFLKGLRQAGLPA